MSPYHTARLGSRREDATAPGWVAHAFLVALLALLAANVVHLVRSGDYGADRYGGLVVALMLLFNHLAFQYAKRGRASVVLKSTAFAWIVAGLAYMFWLVSMT